MADTLPNLQLPHGEWINATQARDTYPGYTPGEQIDICNLSKAQIHMHVSATEPSDDDGYIYLDARGSSKMTPVYWFRLDAGESAVWLKAVSGAGLVNIQI